MPTKSLAVSQNSSRQTNLLTRKEGPTTGCLEWKPDKLLQGYIQQLSTSLVHGQVGNR